jgi:hypothetical protein
MRDVQAAKHHFPSLPDSKMARSPARSSTIGEAPGQLPLCPRRNVSDEGLSLECAEGSFDVKK